jgi:hypothetical protein
LRDLNLEDSTL